MHYLRPGGARAAAVVAANATFPAVLLAVDGYPDPDPDGRPDLGAHVHARPIRGTHKGHHCQEGVRIWPGGYVLPSGLG